MRIQVLGPVRAWVRDVPVELSLGRRTVLGLLALAGGQPMSRGEIVDALWGEQPPPTAVNVIQTHVKHLRRELEPDRAARSRSAVLPHIGDGYALRVPAEDLDLLRFRRLLAEAVAVRHDDPGAAAAVLTDALAQWQGAPLMDVPALAGHPKVLALAEERRIALARYGELLIALGRVEEALPALREAAAAQPLDEAGQARLVRAYAAAGRRAQAFETFHEARRLLAEELGVDPGPELVAAQEAVLRDPVAPAEAVRGPAPRPGRAPAQLPADVPGFTGRDEELALLDMLLEDSDEHLTAVVISAVSGTAGVGKTALAVRWAHRARARFPDGQLYVNLRGYDAEQPMPPEEALARFLRALGLPGADVPFDLDERAACYRSLLDGRRMLIVLDNAASVGQVRPLLPGTASCAVLVTSRDTLSGLVARHGAQRLDLDLLPRADAVDLVRRLIGERVTDDPAAAADLVTRCARLPLALRVAAELAAARPDVPLAGLVAELADERRRLALLDAGGDPETGVRAVFSWSYRQLSPAAARMFRLAGLHPGADLDGYAAAALAGCDAGEARELLEVLARAHLVQRTTAGRFTLHDLLRAYAIDLGTAHGDGDRDAALTRLCDAWLFIAGTAIDILYPAERHRRTPTPRPDGPVPPLPHAEAAQAWLDAERANLAALVAHSAAHGRPAHAVRFTIALLRHLESGGHYAEAIAMHGHAQRSAREIGDAGAEAHLLTNMAVLHVQQGHYEQAADLLVRAVALARRCGDHAAEARALGNLGHVDQWQGRYEAAARRLEEALALCRRTGDGAGEARALGNLGQVYRRQGRLREASDHLAGAVRICRRVGDPVGEGYALVSLGHVAAQRGDPGQAEAHHRQALAVFRRTSERAGVAHALDGLGTVTLDAGRLREAIAVFRRIGERAGEARSGNSLGETLLATGRPARAREQHAAALELATAIGDRYEQARAHAGLAAAAEALADPSAVERHRRGAAALYAEIGVPMSFSEPGSASSEPSLTRNGSEA